MPSSYGPCRFMVKSPGEVPPGFPGRFRVPAGSGMKARFVRQGTDRWIFFQGWRGLGPIGSVKAQSRATCHIYQENLGTASQVQVLPRSLAEIGKPLQPPAQGPPGTIRGGRLDVSAGRSLRVAMMRRRSQAKPTSTTNTTKTVSTRVATLAG
jgi:hypothetical protein